MASASLDTYNEKRDFEKTREPRGKAGRKAGDAYLIQKHDATRLHYDFRLEHDGVLLSWAVTRGPSYDPSDKRLAVRTEDHPLDYGSFEGTIPKGEYGGGTVMLWDTGSWKPLGDVAEGLERGELKFELSGKRLKGRWVLVRMKPRKKEKRENWLLIKEKDELARPDEDGEAFLAGEKTSVATGRTMAEIAEEEGGEDGNRWSSENTRKKGGRKSGASEAEKKAEDLRREAADGPSDGLNPQAKPASARNGKGKGAGGSGAASLDDLAARYGKPQLATLVDAPPARADWLHEIKFDGYRLIGLLSDGSVRLVTRNGHDWTKKFDRLARAFGKLGVADAVFDMEAVVLDGHGRSDFQKLQNALSGETDSKEKKPIVAMLFDCLHLDGEDLTKAPLTTRKARLKALLDGQAAGEKKILRYSDHIEGKGEQMIARSCSMGLEGVVSKKADAPYRAGRTKSWLKSKCIKRQEFVIIGFTKAAGGARAIGALHLGYFGKDGLAYAGKCGTGFTDASGSELRERLDKMTRKTAPVDGLSAAEKRAATWVTPKLLAEVAFTEWTGEGKIRHPSFKGLREDKPAGDVVREAPEDKAEAADAGDGAGAGKARAASGRSRSREKRAAAAEAKSDSKADAASGSDGRKSRRSGKPIRVCGVEITHPDRPVFDDENGPTKGDLADYYGKVAKLVLADISGHAVSLLRCPGGIGEECFFQRSVGKGWGAEVKPVDVTHAGKTTDYFYVEDAKGLIELVQMGGIELHPWASTVDRVDVPDRLVFDLDPDEGVPFEAVKLAARDLGNRLSALGLDSFVKATGGKGLHVVVPLSRRREFPEIKAFAEGFAEAMVRDVPRAYVATMSKAKRKGKIFIDYFRNDHAATSIADYSVRARPGARVAVPLSWEELDALESASAFTMAGVLERIDRGEAFERPAWRQSITKAMLGKLGITA
ncbi:DNA ligase D [Jiella sonneratiae]|uniref:DNA ligase (ATP) n=1 Tax=Jiella sonneratiae TaxID=2816856 RepID=A0ABS3J009_9HYPH|nr:DNA ligase D [Jiella sonneratiae]MBO0903016.1 DNA ligase D [Jiella sonneratiae]